MSSGRQMSEENFRKFMAWAASKTDADFHAITGRRGLSRTEIAKECGFAKSALAQNPRIKDALLTLENDLRARGILQDAADDVSEDVDEAPSTQLGCPRRTGEAERLTRLEQENASLRAENAELKKQLQRYTVLHEALSLTGRVPR